jgi:F-type H+-transporting ATPase subunit b
MNTGLTLINSMVPLAISMEDVTEKAEFFGVDGTKLAIQLVVFLILFAVLWKFAFKPIQQVLDERKKRIEDSIANAERIKKELEEAEQQRAERMKETNAEVSRILEEARTSADNLGSKKVQEAVAQAEAVLKKAEEAAEREREQMMGELKSEMGRLVVDTTAKVVGKILTDEDRQRLQSETLEQLK